MHAGQTLHASFDVPAYVDASGELHTQLASICRGCCEQAVIAWARKARGDAQEPPDAPTPRPPSSPVEAAAQEARTFNARAA